MNRFLNGMSYIIKSTTVFMNHPKMILYPIIPVTITFFVMVFGIYFGYDYINSLLTEYSNFGNEPEWWQMVISVVWTMLIFAILLITSGYFFVTITKIFAAPFNDLLSEKVELYYNPDYVEPTDGFAHFLKILYPTLIEEIKKVGLILLGFAVIMFTFILPFINVVSPFLLIIYSIVVMSIDFVDYPLARRLFTVKQKIDFFKTHSFEMLGFGTAIFLLFLIPFMQLFILPVAVISGTLLFIDLNKSDYQII